MRLMAYVASGMRWISKYQMCMPPRRAFHHVGMSITTYDSIGRPVKTKVTRKIRQQHESARFPDPRPKHVPR